MESYLCVCSVAQWWPTLCNPMDYRPPGPSVHRIFKARSGFPFPTTGKLPDPGIDPMSLALVGRFFSTVSSGKTFMLVYCCINWTFFFSHSITLKICFYNNKYISIIIFLQHNFDSCIVFHCIESIFCIGNDVHYQIISKKLLDFSNVIFAVMNSTVIIVTKLLQASLSHS